MKKWALLTVVLYLLCVSVLVVPLLLAFAHANEEGLIRDFHLWIVPLLVLVQVVLLLVPIDVARERPVKRRRVVVAAVMGAMPLALLALGFFGAVALMGCGEGAIRDYLYSWPALVFVLISWLVWGVVFYRSTLTKDPAAFNKSLTRWLLGGSILCSRQVESGPKSPGPVALGGGWVPVRTGAIRHQGRRG